LNFEKVFTGRLVIKLTEEKNGKDVLIWPKKGRGDPTLGSDVLMVMIPSELKRLKVMSGAKKIHPGTGFYDLFSTKDREGVSITLSGPFLGAPQAVMAMEKMIALGARRFWVYGYCGSLQNSISIGDLILPTHAVSEEGTSKHYPIDPVRPKTNETLNRIIEEKLEQSAIPFTRGPVWSTDAPYRETVAKVKNFRREGILAVEMEMSALMTVALFRKVRLSGLLVVSDELFELKWRPGFSSQHLIKKTRLASEILLESARSAGA
jgi:uridine phosphorylase